MTSFPCIWVIQEIAYFECRDGIGVLEQEFKKNAILIKIDDLKINGTRA